jgi:glycosyltransferase involved in cell wall biosynthesis
MMPLNRDTSDSGQDNAEDERAALILALKAQVRSLQHQLAVAERQRAQQAAQQQWLQGQLTELTAALHAIHASRHWQWVNRYWIGRARLLGAYPAFRQWLRRVISHAARARLLKFVGKPEALPPPALAHPPLSSQQSETFGQLLQQLGLPGEPADYAGLSDGQQADLRQVLDFLPSQVGAVPRLIPASALPLQPAPSRRRLLFVCGEFPNALSGGGGAVFNLIQAQSRDHDIYLCAWYQPRQDEAALKALEPYCRRIKLASVQELESGQLSLLEDLLDGVPADVVLYFWPRALACYQLALGRQHVFMHVESISLRLLTDLQFSEPFSPAWRTTVGKLITALKVELVDTLPLAARIAVTRVDGEFLARLAPQLPCVVLSVPVDFAAAALPDQPPEPDTLVFVGNYLHYPNADAAQFFCREILPLVRQACPHVRLYLAGANPTAAVRALADGQRVMVTGTVPDVRPYIQRAAVCIAPLVSGAGMRTKINHYSALQRVCVATSLAAVDLPHVHGQSIWVADDPAQFAAYVTDMLRQPERARAMGQAAYQAARAHFDLPVITEHFYRLYAALDQAALLPVGLVADSADAL